MTKYGLYELLQVLHILHREEKKIIYLGSHGGRRMLGYERENKKKHEPSINSLHTNFFYRVLGIVTRHSSTYWLGSLSCIPFV